VIALPARAGRQGRLGQRCEGEAVPGVRQVVQIPSGVAVLADGYWAAKLGAMLSRSNGITARTARSPRRYLEMLPRRRVGRRGRPQRRRRQGRDACRNKIEAEYEAPYLSHSCMEPLNCTAWVRKTGRDLGRYPISGPAQGILAQVAGVAPGKVKVNTMYLGGGFGRAFSPDPSSARPVLSQDSGKPVEARVQPRGRTRGYF